MPAKKIKLKNGMFRVVTPNGVHSKQTTEEKADAQIRLLNAVEHGWKPTGKK
jgi:predicted nucleotidyltransferase